MSNKLVFVDEAAPYYRRWALRLPRKHNISPEIVSMQDEIQALLASVPEGVVVKSRINDQGIVVWSVEQNSKDAERDELQELLTKLDQVSQRLFVSLSVQSNDIDDDLCHYHNESSEVCDCNTPK